MFSFLKNLFSKQNNFETDIFLVKTLGFTPNNFHYYHKALTHRSASSNKKSSNERLEFLGDGVLDTIVSEHLFLKYQNYSEGRLSKVKSVIVNRKHLNKLAKNINLDKVIKTDLSTKSDSIYGNAFEALIGAVFLDQGFVVTKKFVSKILKEHVNIKHLERHYRNYKGELVEWCQKNKKKLEFKLIEEIVIDNKTEFKVQLLIDETIISEAQKSSKKIAEKKAAERAFNTIFVSNSIK